MPLDLIVLVADKAMRFSLQGALGRPQAMGIRPVHFDFIEHPNRDGGVRKTGPELLALKRSAATHSLLLLDYEGSGAHEAAIDLEADLDVRLTRTWGAHSKAVVIEPELDVWMWGADNAMAAALDWQKNQSIRDWVATKGYILTESGKPVRPKEALHSVMREVGQPPSAALYQEIAQRISLQRCRDAAFIRLKEKLQEWFPAQ